MSVIRQVKLTYLHPLIFILYSVLYIVVLNGPHVDARSLIVPLVMFLAGAVVLFMAAYLLMKNMGQAAMLTSIIAILFFSYGRVYDLVQRSVCGSPFMPCDQHWRLTVIWLVLMGFGIMASRRKTILPYVEHINTYLTLVVVMLVSVAVIRLVVYTSSRPDTPPERSHWIINQETVEGQRPEPPPDIYYIMLDEYTRQDILQDYFGYDNGPFIRALEERGFYVADQSKSNYPRTFLSLASSLNMQYVDEDDNGSGIPTIDDAHIMYVVRDNAVTGFLKQHGYQYIHKKSTFSITADNPYADYLLDPGVVSPGRELLYQTTMLPGLFAGTVSSFDKSQYKALNITRGFELVATMPDYEPDIPKFVFAHFMTPHTPYVFDAEGNVVPGTEEDNLEGYVAQVAYTNKLVLDLIDTLLAESEQPPIIILQGDHGSKSTGALEAETFSDEFIYERTAILNAYYLPGYEGDPLYETITPVNSFRLIFDAYFGTSFGLLDDLSYFR